MQEKKTNQIAACFKKRPEVVAVYLFGSVATGKYHQGSDVDIGILLDRSAPEDHAKELDRCHRELSRQLRKDVHLLRLNAAGETLMRQIYLKGRCILAYRTRTLAIFNMAMVSRIADFAYYQRRFQSGFANKVLETGGNRG